MCARGRTEFPRKRVCSRVELNAWHQKNRQNVLLLLRSSIQSYPTVKTFARQKTKSTKFSQTRKKPFVVWQTTNFFNCARALKFCRLASLAVQSSLCFPLALPSAPRQMESWIRHCRRKNEEKKETGDWTGITKARFTLCFF